MCLTDGPRLLTTPTYHVFDMYQAHQGGQSLRTICQADDITFYVQGQERRIPGLMGSASLKNGTLTLSVVNPNATLPVETSISLQGHQPSHATVTTLTHSDIRAHNTFEAPETVKPSTVSLSLAAGEWRYDLAPASVTVFSIRLS